MRSTKFPLVAALSLVTLLAGSSYAAGFSAGIGAGIHKFTGDAGEGIKTGIVVQAFGDYMISPMWAAGADLGYSTSKHEDDGKLAEDVYPGGGLTGKISSSFKVTSFGAHAKFFPPMTGSPIAPYLVAGVGMYNWKGEWSVPGQSQDESGTDFGFRGGAGANYSVNPVFGINAEADFRSIMTENESTNMFSVRAGVVFKLASK
ncbi:MAG: porin family protein [Candidatus Eisenbacteria bacterium]|nr:porin family protein [Candidatus Eisenbacteria bacterium]